MARPGHTTTIIVNQQPQSPTHSSHSGDYLDSELGIHIHSTLATPESDRVGSSWDGIESEIGSSEPGPAQPDRTRNRSSGPPPRRHLSNSRPPTRPPSAPSVPRQGSPDPSSSVDPSEEFSHADRTYPVPPAGQNYGGNRGPAPPGGPPSFMSNYTPHQYAAPPGSQMIPTFGAQQPYPPYQQNPFQTQGPASVPGPPGFLPQGFTHPGGMPAYPSHDLTHYAQGNTYAYPQGNHGYGMPPQPMGPQSMGLYNLPPHLLAAMNSNPSPPPKSADPEKDKQIKDLNDQLEAHRAEKAKALKEIEEQEAARKRAATEAEAKAAAEKAAAEELAKFKAKAEADAREKAEAEVKAKAMAEAAKAEADAKAAADLASFKVKVEADAKEKAEAELKARKAAEAAKAEADKKAADEMAAFRAKAEIEAREKVEAAIKAKTAADAAAAAEAAAKAKAAADAQKLIEMQAKIDADQKALDELRAGKTDKKKPIHFKDALNRKFSFPFEICATWDGMESLIRQAFDHVDVLGPLVAQRQYDLLAPNEQIILPQIWESMIEPDLSITMRMWPIPEPKRTQHITPEQFEAQQRHAAAAKAAAMKGRGGAKDHPPPPPPVHPGGTRHHPDIAVVHDKGSRKKSTSTVAWIAGKPKPAGKGQKKTDDGCHIM